MGETSEEGGTVLVVDDECELLGLYETWLTQCDAVSAVEATSDTAEALELLDEDVDVFITNRWMPDWNAETLQSAIDRVDFPGTVVVISGDERAGEFGRIADYYEVKPVLRPQLHQVVEAALSGSEPLLG